MTDWQIRDSVSMQAKLDETFSLLKKIADHLGIDTELNDKYFKNADQVRYERNNSDNNA